MVLCLFPPGRYHGAMLTNCEEWEDLCVRAGRLSGDLLHPLIYCPELHYTEFTSAVADMKNSSAVSYCSLHVIVITIFKFTASAEFKSIPLAELWAISTHKSGIGVRHVS